MAEALINFTESKTGPSELSDPPHPASGGSPFQQRKIEFHLARKTFTGFSIGSGDFRLETLNPSSSMGPQRSPGGSNQPSAGRKPDGSEFLENGLDPELSFGITFRRIGAGLENLGNTCFLNSVLQCLTYTEPLAAYLQSGKHQTSCRTSGFCALCAIQRHVSRALQSTGRILAPKDLVSNLRCISRNFRNARQEDAHEYMVNLLESMHKCCLPSGVPSESPGAYDKSLVHKIFGGRLRSQVKCNQCSFCSNKFDPFLDLSLEIAGADSLYKALQHFTITEQLDEGGRQYQCQQCKQKVKARKQLTIHKAPYVLTIHLKRFGSHVPGQKIDKKIHFGPTLDLKPFVTGPYDKELKYTLYGVLVHAGWSTHSGHYYCFVRTSSGMWYSLDDNQVIQVNERKVLEQKAYMLFYVRDRNFALKKPLDVVKKEDMATNSIGRNKTYSNFNQGFKETIQSGPILKSSNSQNSSAVVAQREVVNSGALKETITKEASIQKISGVVKAECSSLNRDPLLECSSKPPLKDSVKEFSILNQNKGECLPQSYSSVKGSSDDVKLDDGMISTIGAKIVDDGVFRSTKSDLKNSVTVPPSCKVLYNDIKKESYDSVAISLNCNEDRSTKKDLSGSIGIPPNCSIPHRSPGDMCISEKTSSGKNGAKASSPDPIGRTLEKVSPVMLFGQTGREDGQSGGFSQESAGGNSLGETVGNNGKKTVDTVSTELSSLLVTEHIAGHKKNLDGKPHKKLKKKHLKSQVTSLRLGSNILFGKSLGLRKKKKHKRSKQLMFGTENLSHEHLLDWDCMPMDLGPSTPEKIKTMPFSGLALTRRKGMKSGSKKDKSVVLKEVVTNSNGDLLMGIVGKEFQDRTGQNGAMLATDDQPQKSSITASAGNQVDARGTNSSKDSRRDSMQNGLMSMLTRGLEETLVARWDEMELSSPMTESSGVETMSIGYVADEWDEEYDRGKRKKVRSFKNSFDGPNPFQLIATKKSKVKKAKMDQSSSGNRPFRI